MLNNQNRTRKIIKLLLIVLVICFLYFVIVLFSRSGEAKVTFKILPDASELFINNKKVNGRNTYLAPGKYTVSARAQGYKDDTTEITIGDESKQVILLPQPESQEILAFLEKNPQIQAQREALGGQKNDAIGQKITENNPLLAKLPHTEITGPFSINYSLTPSSDGRYTIFIQDSSPTGRQNAIAWIRNQGFNPSELLIIFADFKNPLNGEAQND